MIETSELTSVAGVDDDLALRIIGHARSIAPFLDSLPPGRDFDTAVAILRSVAKTAARGGIKSQRIAGAAVEYFDPASSFSADDRLALQALRPASATESTAGPVGSFPLPGLLGKVWPESETY